MQETLENIKQEAKLFATRLNVLGVPVSNCQVLEGIAASKGYRTWHAYRVTLSSDRAALTTIENSAEAAYLENGGMVCPNCGQEDVEGEPLEAELDLFPKIVLPPRPWVADETVDEIVNDIKRRAQKFEFSVNDSNVLDLIRESETLLNLDMTDLQICRAREDLVL